MRTLRRLRAINDRIAVDGFGIWYLRSEGGQTVVPWSEFNAIKRYAIPFNNFIGILDTNGEARIRMNDRIENFDEFERLIADHTKSVKE